MIEHIVLVRDCTAALPCPVVEYCALVPVEPWTARTSVNEVVACTLAIEYVTSAPMAPSTTPATLGITGLTIPQFSICEGVARVHQWLAKLDGHVAGCCLGETDLHILPWITNRIVESPRTPFIDTVVGKFLAFKQ